MAVRDLAFDIRAKDKTKAGFDAARRNAVGFRGDLDRVGQSMIAMAGYARAFAAGFAGAAGGTFLAGMKQAVADVARIADVADKLGIATDELQMLTFGFEQAGVAVELTERGLAQWVRRIGEAHTGSGELRIILDANGVALTDGNGQLRNSVELLSEIANLIKGAASDQERVVVAAAAFGTAAADEFALALRNGEDGLNDLMREAENAGGVIDEELVRRAAELDDEFAAIARTIEINVKSALVTSASVIDAMIDKTNSLEERLAEIGNSSFFGRMAEFFGADMSQTYRVVPGQGIVPSADRKNGRLGDPTMDDMQRVYDELLADWKKTFGRKTVIPGGDDPDRPKRVKVLREERDAYAEVIKKLDEERQMIGLNAIEQRILEEQRRAGVDAMSVEGNEIERRIRQMEEEQGAVDALAASQERWRDVMEDIADVAQDFASDLVRAFGDGQLSAEEFDDALGNLKDRALELLLSKGFDLLLNNLLGGLGSGLGSLFGSAPAAAAASATAASSTAFSNLTSDAKAQEIVVKLVDTNGNRVEATETKRGGGTQFDVSLDQIIGDKIGTRGTSTRRALEALGLSGQLSGR